MLKLEHIDRSDNLRIIHYDRRKQAAAFMQLMEGIEAGTAMVKVPAPDGFAGGLSTAVGTQVRYRAMAGDSVYDAVIVAVRDLGKDSAVLIDIDVIVPGVSEPMRLTKVRFKWTKAF